MTWNVDGTRREAQKIEKTARKQARELKGWPDTILRHVKTLRSDCDAMAKKDKQELDRIEKVVKPYKNRLTMMIGRIDMLMPTYHLNLDRLAELQADLKAAKTPADKKRLKKEIDALAKSIIKTFRPMWEAAGEIGQMHESRKGIEAAIEKIGKGCYVG